MAVSDPALQLENPLEVRESQVAGLFKEVLGWSPKDPIADLVGGMASLRPEDALFTGDPEIDGLVADVAAGENAPGLLGAAQAAFKAGLRGEALVTAIAIAQAESGGNPRAHNPNASTGDNSYGYWQINMLGGLQGPRLRQFGISSNDQLFDANTNAKAMYIVSGGGSNWRPWSVYKSGKYKQHMDTARQMAAMVEAGTGSRPLAAHGMQDLVKFGGVTVGRPVAQALNGWLEQGGRPVSLTDGYRTRAQQEDLYRRKPGLAAPPGRSFHEKGLAIDVNFNGWSAADKNRFINYMKSVGFTWGGDFKRVKEPWHFGLGE